MRPDCSARSIFAKVTTLSHSVVVKGSFSVAIEDVVDVAVDDDEDAVAATSTGASAALLPQGMPDTCMCIPCEHYFRPRYCDRLYRRLHVERCTGLRMRSIAHAATQDFGQIL